MPRTTVLFDLDGTLYPHQSELTRQFETRMTEFVAQLLKTSLEQAKIERRRFFTTYGTTMRGVQLEHGIDPDTYLRYVHGFDSGTFVSPDPQLNAMLERLPGRRAILTNAPIEHAEPVLDGLGVRHHFEQVFDIRWLNFVSKPAPEVYQRVLHALAIRGEETIFIEDSAQNLPPAREQGVTTILVRHGPDSVVRPGVDYVVDDIYEALGLVHELLTATT
jgi:putative hydrolase of the HAD superfamily